ncbi:MULTISPECIES: hypothetical protein [unclassified Streptomyces]|uniref:hypothetical protein n=1 Tax=unclassified Streptomyces TaxID=2593676 RepID=UPI0036E9631C
MGWSKLKQDEVRVRRTELLKLRRACVPYEDPRVERLGYSSPDVARRDLSRALEANRAAEAAEVSIYRQMENERLDALLEAAWPRATTPTPVLNKDGEVIDHALDMRAVDTVLRLMDRRAKLNGLDMPVKAEVTGAGGGPLAFTSGSVSELRSLINAAGDPDPDDENEEDEGAEGDADDDTDND